MSRINSFTEKSETGEARPSHVTKFSKHKDPWLSYIPIYLFHLNVAKCREKKIIPLMMFS